MIDPERESTPTSELTSTPFPDLIAAFTEAPVFDDRGKAVLVVSITALMSAENPQAKSSDGLYHFRMPQPIPAYLLALAVGDIDFRSFSENSGVYGEPPVIDKAHYEFVDTPRMIANSDELARIF